MDLNMAEVDGHASSKVRDTRDMPLSSSRSGYPASTAAFLEPKASTEQMMNGHQRARPPHARTNAYPASAPRFNPSQLLNPKGFDSVNRHKETEKMIASSNPETKSSAAQVGSMRKRDYDAVEGRGMGNLIEQVHNVSKREDKPPKKQRRDYTDKDDEAKPMKAVFAGGGKGGEIGEYMKEKRKEGQADLKSANTVVDLTTADDDEVVLVSDKSDDKEVCYGRLENTLVHAHLVPTPSNKATYLTRTDWPAMKLTFKRYAAVDNIIRVLDPTGRDFGNVDARTALGLAPLMDSPQQKLRTQPRLDVRKKKNGEVQGAPCSDFYKMTLNLYGPRSKAEGAGRHLSQKQLYLRTPYAVDNGIEVYNPHAPKVPVLPRTSLSASSAAQLSGTGYVTRTIEEIRSDVLGMFDSLEKSENLPEMEPNDAIVTPLLSHQKQGLYFMTNKEMARVFSEKEEANNSLWRLRLRPNGQRMFFNVITGKEERKKPPEVLGGILADMMGLGKTLTVLSLVVGSCGEALEWASEKPPEVEKDGSNSLIVNSKATLLISPLSTVANWEEQIKAHLKPGSLKYYIYHGNSRCNDINELAQYDIIITTYSIVSSEFNGRRKDVSPLLHTNWFRIVLDEAHMIREQSTRQSQAICTLSAQRRWAVTGTPVQNRLDDLGALIKFLRIKPFDEKGGFTQFILSPFKNADPEILPKLRLLVDSFTLRRLKDRIDLLPRHEKLVRLPFSQEERVLYEWFAKDSDNKMKIIVGEEKKSLGGKTYVHILRAILRLRLICAHGKELLSEEDLKLTEGFSMNNAIDLEDEDDGKPSMSARQAYELLMLCRESDTDTCTQCGRKIGPKESISEDVAKDEIIGFMLPCYQILCRDCHLDFKTSIRDKVTIDNHFTCPFCDQYLRLAFFELTQGGIEAAEDARLTAKENPRQAKIMGRYGGAHSKTKALIESLLESQAESKANPEERPIKSVVFSGWTSHLDLIQIALEDHAIKYVRLDGKMSRTQRTAALDTFRDDPDYPVILVSIMAGGLGLNLTAASKVFVMEPQFNPAAEAQAVDRVHRLGQKREVTIVRFIMQDSFEEKMLLLQRKKQNLADISMNRGKLDRAEATKRRLEELRSLFK